MYEGAPNYPAFDRFWAIIEKHKVNILYTAPTAIRTFIKWGDEWPKKHDLSSLRLLGTVGEPINPEAWMWYREVIGGNRCPIVDTWWQTETGAIMISPMPGAVATKPGSATRPLPGIAGGSRYPQRRARAARLRRISGHQEAVAFDAAHRLWRSRALRTPVLVAIFRACISPATARAKMPTATSGSWAASTTCSTSPDTGSARWKSSRRWWRIRKSPKPPSSDVLTRSRARRLRPSSRWRSATSRRRN